MASSPTPVNGNGAALRLELLPDETRGQLLVVFRVAGDVRTFRLLPVRDPRQPRFWGLAVSTRMGDLYGESVTLWAGEWGMQREALPARLEEIRTDPDAWLADPARARLVAGLRACLAAPTLAEDLETQNAAKPAAPAPAARPAATAKSQGPSSVAARR